MQNVQLGDKRSAELQSSDREKMAALLQIAKTKTAAAKVIGVDPDTFARMEKGSCSPATLKKLREIDLKKLADMAAA